MRSRRLADEVGVLGETLDENGARPVERGGRRPRPPWLGVDVSGRLLLRVEAGRVAEQRIGQRFEARLARDLGLGAPLRLERQVDVLESGLRVGSEDLRLERVVEFALRFDGFEDRGPALLELAQVAQPLLEGAQLRVVEAAGDFLGGVTGR